MNKHLNTQDLSALSVDDRLQLIEELWDSLDVAEVEARPIPDWQKAKLDERLDALEAGTSISSTWADVRLRITGRT